jgi:CRP-like cAMP-binding protein
MRALTRSYESGTVLFEENDPGSRMYVVTSGKVKISRRLGDTEIVLATIAAGEFFGEMALLEQLPRSATATTVEPSELIEIDEETFHAMLRDNSDIAIRMMRKLCGRLRDTDLRLQSALAENGIGRMLEVLRGLVMQGTPAEAHWVRVRPSFDFFARAGITIGQRSDIEERLQRAALMQRDGEGVLVANEATLVEFSDYLQLHQTYAPLIAHELGDILGADLHASMVDRLVKRVLIDNMATEGGDERSSQRVLEEYARYLSLKQRFGPI